MKKFYMLIIGLIMLFGARAQWIPQNSGTTNDLNSIFFSDVNTGYAAGNAGTILKTSDGGLKWTAQTSGTDTLLRVIYFPTATTGFAAGDGIVLKTTNGGENWMNLQDTVIEKGYWLSIESTDSLTVFVCGSFYNKACIIRTYDQGRNWSIIYQDPTPQPPGSVNSYLSSMHFIDPNTGFVAGKRNWDTGTTWGYTGLLFKSSNAWVDWDYVSNNLDFDSYSSLSFTDSDTGYVIGSIDLGWTNWTDTLVQTTDGGTNWSKTNIGSITGNLRIKSIFFTTPDTGFIVGSNGKILKTEDGGESYFMQNSGSTHQLSSVFFTHNNNGYIAGDSGTILKTTNGGGTSTGTEESPIQHSTFNIQNYPNPTSGIVDFRLSIVDFRWVSLKIYNAQGQEVAKLLDQELPAGEHTVRWDACGLPTGIYFYRLSTDDQRLTTGTGKIVKY